LRPKRKDQPQSKDPCTLQCHPTVAGSSPRNPGAEAAPAVSGGRLRDPVPGHPAFRRVEKCSARNTSQNVESVPAGTFQRTIMYYRLVRTNGVTALACWGWGEISGRLKTRRLLAGGAIEKRPGRVKRERPIRPRFIPRIVVPNSRKQRKVDQCSKISCGGARRSAPRSLRKVRDAALVCFGNFANLRKGLPPGFAFFPGKDDLPNVLRDVFP
jgi:hypothetical protein